MVYSDHMMGKPEIRDHVTFHFNQQFVELLPEW
jgi:hypothetical protein